MQVFGRFFFAIYELLEDSHCRTTVGLLNLFSILELHLLWGSNLVIRVLCVVVSVNLDVRKIELMG